MPDHLYRQFKLIQLKEELVDWLINRHNVYQMELNYLIIKTLNYFINITKIEKYIIYRLITSNLRL